MLKRSLVLFSIFGIVGCFPEGDNDDKSTDVPAFVIESITPALNATDVFATSIISVKLPHGIDDDLLTSDQVSLVSQTTGKPVAGDLTFNEQLNELQFAPSSPLANGTTYSVELAAGVTDVYQQVLAGHSWSFTTNHDYRFEFQSVSENCDGADCDVELWTWDEFGEAYLIADINPTASSNPNTNQYRFNGLYYFSADDGTHGFELWATDGTPAHTELVANLRTGSDSSSPSNFMEFNGELFFSAVNDSSHRVLWKTDGTEAGTVQVYDPKPAGTSAGVSNLYAVNNKLVFTAYGEDEFANDVSKELYVSDGTTDGTELLKDLNPGIGNSGANDFILFNDLLYFHASDGNETATEVTHHSYSLFVTDGTEAGTQLVKDINPTENSSSEARIEYVRVFNNQLFFLATDGTNGSEPWISDGTDAGTVMLKDTNAAGSSSARAFGEYNGLLYFADNDTGLWVTDGTEAGTVLVKAFDSLRDLEVIDGGLVLSGSLGADTGLWFSDGSESGTNFYFTRSGSSWLSGTLGGGAIFYENVDGETTYYFTDGTAGGTQKILSENGLAFEYFDL